MTTKFLLITFTFTFLTLTLTNALHAQGVGFSTAYSSSNAYYVDFFYLRDTHSFHLGGSYQLSDQLGKRVREQKANYGRNIVGQGSFFRTFDLGYNYHMENRFFVGGELSVGSKNNFTNYEDNRFRGGGYHMVDAVLTGGIGVNAGYRISDLVFGFTGYHSLRKFTFGLRFAPEI